MLSIVIPAYNEEKRINKTLGSLKDWLPNSEIIVLFDGNDNTAEVAKMYGVKVIEYKTRVGKGAALRDGIIRSMNKKILLLDADLPVMKNDIEKILLTDADLVLPKRKIIGMPLRRRFLHKAFILLVKIFFPSLAEFSDFQSGVKLIDKEKVSNLIDELIINDLLFDVNLIYAFKRRGYKIKEVEISYIHDESNSKISKKLVKVIILMFLSLVKLRVYYSPLRKILHTNTFNKVQSYILNKLR
ncbi:dolichyl-phosphate mannose synthase [Sulfolobus sp. A20]|uniref:glycosyltransferase n=1 Tax=Sulfolobaceae TaxID=118883 RepID=UPI000845C669|nr:MULTISPECIES: glycosyltransferase [unclassified Sulfolobus]TRM73317.1 dolichyl-phosphate mannose synthase [Sulfolobus sp. E5]TRM76381.1 dolichyl-phosphate mannose synthase [Sulfolobus sp. A20-N-F8]TRM83885.1 dolichyl-phosphate mannose synthase [Sulfolobus sp. A20-N-F6]TRM89480.1 dolichyl-phosphate mannose synthase [Sulfolobus sp. C3]TRN00072.1 dolichyl-phosphate mannose synthase [Sulfolobus sp. E1]